MVDIPQVTLQQQLRTLSGFGGFHFAVDCIELVFFSSSLLLLHLCMATRTVEKSNTLLLCTTGISNGSIHCLGFGMQIYG